MLKQFTIGLAGVLFFSQISQASLQVAPTRLLITDQTKSGELTLQHTGDKPTRYRISVAFYDVDANGQVKKIEDPGTGKQSIASMVRFSPRSVTLQPGLKQVVRVLIRATDLPEGDYRAHVYFETADDDIPIPTVQPTDGKTNMKLSARVAVAVPVVFRKGKVTSTVHIAKTQWQKEGESKGLRVSFNKEGAAFAYGDLMLMDEANHESISLLKGVSIYNPVLNRTLLIPEDKLAKLTTGAKFTVKFVDAEDPGRDPASQPVIDSVATTYP